MVRPDPGGGVLIDLKVVPGARRDAVAGRLGDRLKVRVAAAPEDGKANAAVCALLASELGVRERDASIVKGHASPEKTVRVLGIDVEDVRTRWP